MNTTDDTDPIPGTWEPFPGHWRPMGTWRLAGWVLGHFALGGCGVIGFLWLLDLVTGLVL